MASEKVIHIKNETEFDQLIGGNAPVLADFWATWCGPCRMLAPTIDELAADFEGRAVVCKVDVDENPALAERYRVMNIPTLLVFKNGELLDKSIGARPKALLAKMLEKAL